MTVREPSLPHDLELSVIIPVYNEDKNIERTLKELKNYLTLPHEIIVVYDRDEDTTVDVVRKLKGTYGNVRLLKNDVARGPSGAIRSGFKAAQAPRICVMMGDLCDDVTQIQELIKRIPSQADIACPSRYCEGGQQVLNNVPRFKVWLPRTASRLLKAFAHLPTLDATNSFKMYSASMIKKLNLTSTISFSVTLEIVVKAHCLGYRIVEIPTVWTDRQHGKSNFKMGRSIGAYLPWFMVAFLYGFLHWPRVWFRRSFCLSPEEQPQ